MKNAYAALGLLLATLGGCFDAGHRDAITFSVQSRYPEDRGIESWISEEDGHMLVSFAAGDHQNIGTALACMGLDHPRLNSVVWTSDDGTQTFWSSEGERRLASARWILPACDEDYLLELDAHGALILYYCENASKAPYQCVKGDVIPKA